MKGCTAESKIGRGLVNINKDRRVLLKTKLKAVMRS